MRNRLAHHVRLVDGSPADILRSDGIGGPREAARHTFESIPAGTVAFVYAPALGAGAGSIARINKPDRNTGEASFILDEPPKLMEAPGVHRPPLAASNRHALADAFEVFKSDTAICALRLADDALADCVVDVAGHALFFATAAFEKPPSALGLFGLEPRADTSVPMPKKLKLGAGIGFPIGIGGYAGDAKIDPEPVFESSRRWLLDIHRGEQVPLAVPIKKVTLALSKLQHLFGALVAHVGDMLAPFDRPDRNRVVIVPKNPVVVSDGAERLEDSLSLPIELVSISDFRDCAHNHLRTKIKASLGLVVGQLVQLVLPERVILPSYLADSIRSFVGSLKRFPEHVSLLVGEKEFYRNGQPHSLGIT